MPDGASRNIYCREIHVTTGPRRAVGELIDDFHHFRATIEHDGSRIRTVKGEALRIPWQTCGGAVDPLRRLEGQLLAPTTRGVGRLTPTHLQCTHLYDAACIAAARAGRQAASVVYRILVPDRVDGQTHVTLHRDSEPLLDWHLDGFTITGPEPFRGRALFGDNFPDWAERHLDVESAEAALALARACMISSGRAMHLDDCARAIDVPGTKIGVCHTYSETHGAQSFRMVGSARALADASDVRRASLDSDPDRVQLFHRPGPKS